MSDETIEPKHETMVFPARSTSLLALSFLAVLQWSNVIPSDAATTGQTQYLDRFTYNNTITRSDGFFDYGPQNWADISCDAVHHLNECIAYIDKWEEAQGWSIQKNYCEWCPDDGTQLCGNHHQAPLALKRSHADPNSTDYFKCIDRHWMKYLDSFCTLDDVIQGNGFQIERHALRVAQPIRIVNETKHTYQLNCHKKDVGVRLGMIDFSEGFSQWWYLSHIDFSTPSEHTQNGKRYDVEAKMMLFYSVNNTVDAVSNELGQVSVFLQAHDNVPPYRYLDILICQWRITENNVRKACGLSPITTPYPSCFPNTRRAGRARNLRQHANDYSYENTEESQLANDGYDEIIQKDSSDEPPYYKTIYDILTHPSRSDGHPNVTRPKFYMDSTNRDPVDDIDDWDAWIEEQSNRMKAEEAAYYQAQANANSEEELEHEYRKLIGEAGIQWFNFFLMLGVRTEYYFRYQGTQTIPPCYGPLTRASRHGSNNIRVMKDPIRIHPRQLDEIKRLLRDRIAPLGDPVASCQPDTAAGVSADGEVWAARPLQYETPFHFEVYCECDNWPSKWPDDREWCAKYTNLTERLYDFPYNYYTDGF